MDPSDLLDLLAQWLPRLRAISDAQAEEVVGTRWNRKQLIGHLLDSALNNHQRFIRLQQGDLAGFPGYDQDHWVDAGAYRHCDWDQLVSLWHLFNLQLASVIRAIPAGCEGRRWVDKGVDLGFLVRDYTGHMRHHLGNLRLPA